MFDGQGRSPERSRITGRRTQITTIAAGYKRTTTRKQEQASNQSLGGSSAIDKEKDPSHKLDVPQVDVNTL